MHGHLEPQPREPQTRVVGLRDAGDLGTDRTLRASDDDRRRVSDLLQAHYVAGRLAQIEFEGRLQEAVAARTLGDLDTLLADLPALGVTPVPADGEGRQERSSRRERRHRRKHGSVHCGEKSFRGHATSYLLVMGLLVAIWALTSFGGYFWPIWPMLGWGIGLVAHGLAARNAPSRPDESGSQHWPSLSTR